jgi:hypothetical protein
MSADSLFDRSAGKFVWRSVAGRDRTNLSPGTKLIWQIDAKLAPTIGAAVGRCHVAHVQHLKSRTCAAFDPSHRGSLYLCEHNVVSLLHVHTIAPLKTFWQITSRLRRGGFSLLSSLTPTS